MSFSQIPGAIGPVDSVKPPKYTDTCAHTPDEQPVCRGCDGEHGGPLYCVWCHGAELAREIQAATAAANAEAAVWRAEAAANAASEHRRQSTIRMALGMSRYHREQIDRLTRERDAAQRGRDVLRAAYEDASRERDALRRHLEAQHVQATFDAPYLVAVGREGGR